MNKERQRKLEARKQRQAALANFGAQFQNPGQDNNEIIGNEKVPKLQDENTVKNLGNKIKKNKKHLQDKSKKNKTVKGKEKSL